MEHSSPDAAATEDSGQALAFVSTDNPALRALEGLVRDLQDGLDHPEIWPLLKEVVEANDHHDILALALKLRPAQFEPRVGKIFDLVAAILHALAIDRAEGLALLRRMEARDGSCPQIAGALFFVDRAGDPAKSSDLATKFCDAPFRKFETLVDGSVAPCCSIWTQKRLGKLDNQSFEDIWNGADAQEMRASILDGSFRHCHKQRCTYITEDTLPERDAVDDPALREIIDEGRTALATKPNWLFLAHDWTCNLACPSCRGELLGANEAQERRFEMIERQIFHPILNSREEVLISASGQGDPWSSQHYRSLLRYMADHELNARLDLHTNALLMTEQKWQQFAGLEKYSPLINVSIDSCTPWVYEIVRRPGKWEKLEPNLRFIARKRAEGIFREFRLNATVQLDNYHEMPEMMDFAHRIGADKMLLYMIQNTGGHLARDFNRKNVADAAHPLYLAFLETLRDPRLGGAIAHLYDVANWRQRAFDASLPSDALAPGAPIEEFDRAIEDTAARGDHDMAVALCAAARSRFGDSDAWLYAEALSLQALGFKQQASYRLMKARAIGCRDPAEDARFRNALVEG